MPFELPDPNAAQPVDFSDRSSPLTPEEAEVVGDDQRRTIVHVFDELEPSVARAEADENEAAVEAVESFSSIPLIRDSWQAVRSPWQTFGAGRQQVAGNSDMSPSGRNKQVKELGSERDAKIQRAVDGVLSTEGDKVLRQFPAVELSAPTVEVSGEIQVLYAAFRHMTAPKFLADGLGRLGVANDPATPPEAKLRANQVLHHAYGPLFERRASQPERHARRYQHLYARAADLIDRHLATVLQKRRHEYASELVGQVRSDFAYLVATAQRRNRWDDVYLVGTEASFPAAREVTARFAVSGP